MAKKANSQKAGRAKAAKTVTVQWRLPFHFVEQVEEVGRAIDVDPKQWLMEKMAPFIEENWDKVEARKALLRPSKMPKE